MPCIKDIRAREILDSRGNPTVNATVILENGVTGCASVPSGASTGSHEALELRDGDKKRYNGKGVLKACANITEKILPVVRGMNVFDQSSIDEAMIKADGTSGKRHFGANAVLAVSMASARAAANELGIPLYRYLGGVNARTLPMPMMNVINAGAHSDAPIDFQEFMIRPVGAKNMRDAVRYGVEVFAALKSLLKKRGLSTSVGDEGGFAPALKSVEDALECLISAVESAGFRAGRKNEGGDISFALDCAASEFYDPKLRIYRYAKSHGGDKTSPDQLEYIAGLVKKYPVESVEDPMSENDWQGWRMLTSALGDKIQIVGDDLLVTNTEYLEKAIRTKAANSILIKMNQIGTLAETMTAVRMAQENGFSTVISHRSGETADTFIADLAVATNAGQIKTGSLSRSDRVEKYNRLMQIEDELMTC